MAQQLQAQGEEVALVAFMETLNLAALPPSSLSTKLYFNYQRVDFHIRNFLLLDAKDTLQFLWEKVKITQSRSNIWWGAFLHKMAKNGKPGQKSEAWTLAQLWDVNDQAVTNYVPQPYSGKVVSFRPRQQYAKNESPEVNWEGLVQELKVVLLPVYPAGMLIEPFVKQLAAELRASIDEAVQTAPTHVLQSR